MMKRSGLACGVLLAALLCATRADASGHLPPLPLESKTFADFGACVEHLKLLHEQDMVGTKDGPKPIDGGATREKLVDTKGVTTDGRYEAHYEATVGWQIRVPGGDGVNRWIQINYSYEHSVWTCNGTSLTGMMDQGYALPGYENLPPQPQDQPGKPGPQGL